MTSQALFNEALDLTQRIWKDRYQIEPMRNIPMPEIDTQGIVKIEALWTDGGLRPNANILAFFVQPVSDENDLDRWRRRLEEWPVRGGLLVGSEHLHLVTPSDSSKRLDEKTLDINAWRETLVSPKPHLFTPKALSQFRQGQLSLSDLEETISERSFTFLLRQQERIDKAFQKAIEEALKKVKSSQGIGSSRNEIQGHVIRVAIAYLAARILQDKGFFGAAELSQTNDPIDLLNLMVTRTNGFFRRALESAQFTNEVIRQQLALYMGQSVSFALTNQRDVGSLYEKAIIELPDDLNGNTWGDLNRHYTPIKVAEKMLELLPLERIRPEERVIFDPAAGSGSLLLAATARLAQMSDIPTDEQSRRDYLANHVIGNDLDRDVNLITQLRYFLARESAGISDLLPSPKFYGENYEFLKKENIIQKIGNKPRILIANPPFEIRGDKQLAFEFVKQSINWLDDGSQFAFILPSSFISGKKHGISDIRKTLSSKCNLFEIWQLPVGTIGVSARQDTCVVSGSVGHPKKYYSISRKVISGAETPEIRNDGYLGISWTSSVKPNGDWTNITAPKVNLFVSTISLLNLFFVFNGVKHHAGNISVENPPVDRPYKRTWRRTWGKEGSLWADPERVDTRMQWIVYDSIALERPRFKVAHLFDKPKILVGSIASISSKNNKPLPVQLDTTGFCPNDSIWLILPIQEAQMTNKGYKPDQQPKNWEKLSFKEQRLWLLGILSSDLAVELSMFGRGTINLTEDILLHFQLPLSVDQEIIDVTAQMVKRDQNREPIPNPDPLREQLNRLVEKSYGNPTWIKRQRTGKSPELKAWQEEQKRKTLTVIGQVLEISQDNDQILLRLSGLLDDNEEAWLPLPQELPGWALDGTVFRAELAEDIETFEELAQRPWALRKFRHTPYPYLSNDELKTKLSRMTGRENF
ncbi:N-6 DNA methylase [Pseudanabaena sp. BC1403]|uniref:N-6 DNA methylase n=1 Tax=Pseudanabaena sp. BC1403 TaxID=2043171 RepID=UPI000CD7FAED|nr:N-6 DNA methylase [Pseudanabaena sp. BC1403]